MERLVPPHAPVACFNGSSLPIHWEFPRYTSFQSLRPQKRSFIFFLKSITNLKQEAAERGESRRVGFLQESNFNWVQWWWWRFSTNWRLFWIRRVGANSFSCCSLSWLTGDSLNSRAGLPSVGDSRNCLHLGLKLSVGSHQRAHVFTQKCTKSRGKITW